MIFVNLGGRVLYGFWDNVALQEGRVLARMFAVRTNYYNNNLRLKKLPIGGSRLFG